MGKGSASGAVSDTGLKGPYFECSYDNPGHVETTLESIATGPSKRAAISSFSFRQDIHNPTNEVSRGVYTNPLTGQRQAFYLEVAWAGGASEGDSMRPVVLVGVGNCYQENCKDGMIAAQEMANRSHGFPVEKTCAYEDQDGCHRYGYKFSGFEAKVGLIDRDKLPDVAFLPAAGSETSAIVCYQREFDYWKEGKKTLTDLSRSLVQGAKVLVKVFNSLNRFLLGHLVDQFFPRTTIVPK